MRRKREEWVEGPKDLDHGSWEHATLDDDEGMDDWEAGFSKGVARAEEEPYEAEEDLWDS